MELINNLMKPVAFLKNMLNKFVKSTNFEIKVKKKEMPVTVSKIKNDLTDPSDEDEANVVKESYYKFELYSDTTLFLMYIIVFVCLIQKFYFPSILSLLKIIY